MLKSNLVFMSDAIVNVVTSCNSINKATTRTENMQNIKIFFPFLMFHCLLRAQILSNQYT